MIIHGFTSTPDSVRSIYNYFSKKDYVVHSMLLPGHAASLDEFSKVQYEEWIKAVHDAYKEIRAISKKTYIISFSLGAALNIELAINEKLDGIFLIAPAIVSIMLLRISVFIYSFAKNLLPSSIKKIGGDIKKDNEYEVVYNRIPTTTLVEFYKATKYAEDNIDKVSCPTYIFHGEKDHLFSAKKIKKAFDKIPSEEKEFFLYKDSYHVLPQDNDIDDILKKIDQIIK